MSLKHVLQGSSSQYVICFSYHLETLIETLQAFLNFIYLSTYATYENTFLGRFYKIFHNYLLFKFSFDFAFSYINKVRHYAQLSASWLLLP